MIEIVIPLNLPVRAVEVTEPTGIPSLRLQREIAWRVEQRTSSFPVKQDGSRQTGSSFEQATQENNVPSAIAEELESLRSQQALFINGLDSLRRAVGDVNHQLDGMLSELQEATIELAEAMTSKLIFEEINENRFPIANLVHEVISHLNTTSGAVIRMHPDDLALLQDYPTIDGSQKDGSLKFVADSTLARGDCKAKAGEISVVYELRRQIDEIRRELLSTVSGHAET